LWLDSASVPIEQGKSGYVNATITNTGEIEDTFIVSYNALEFGNENIILDQNSITLFPLESKVIGIEINVPISHEVKLYDCIINISSLGAIDDGQTMFSVDGFLINVLKSSIKYGVNLTFEKTIYEIKQGESGSMRLNIKNTGTINDIYEIKLVSEDFSISNFEVITNISIKTGAIDSALLNITVPEDQATKSYDITISIISQGALKINQNTSDTKTFELIVLNEKKDKSQEDSLLFLWIIILIIIVTAIILFFYFKNKKKSSIENEIKEDELIQKDKKIEEAFQGSSQQQPEIIPEKSEPENNIIYETEPQTDTPQRILNLSEPTVLEKLSENMEIEE
jgi:hypothetical protein